VISLRNGSSLTFYTRTVAMSAFPDRLQIRMSTNGESINVGTGAFDVGDFTNLLLDINPTYAMGGYPETWTQFTVAINGVPPLATDRLAFRYFVENGRLNGTNSNYIGSTGRCTQSHVQSSWRRQPPRERLRLRLSQDRLGDLIRHRSPAQRQHIARRHSQENAFTQRVLTLELLNASTIFKTLD